MQGLPAGPPPLARRCFLAFLGGAIIITGIITGALNIDAGRWPVALACAVYSIVILVVLYTLSRALDTNLALLQTNEEVLDTSMDLYHNNMALMHANEVLMHTTKSVFLVPSGTVDA